MVNQKEPETPPSLEEQEQELEQTEAMDTVEDADNAEVTPQSGVAAE